MNNYKRTKNPATKKIRIQWKKHQIYKKSTKRKNLQMQVTMKRSLKMTKQMIQNQSQNNPRKNKLQM